MGADGIHQGDATDFERMVDELQRKIFEQELALYPDKVIEEARHPRNLGPMPNPDVRGATHGWCGDAMTFYLRLDGDVIVEATFTTNGCGATVACGSMLTQMVTGMEVEKAGELMPVDLLEALGGLPEESAHCAEVAVAALQNALFNLLALRPYPKEEEANDD